MKQLIAGLTGVILLFSGTMTTLHAQQIAELPYSAEFSLGAKAPVGLTKDDLVAGIAFQLGMGYMLTPHIELPHFEIELGSSSPHDPNMAVIYDYISYYYGRAVQEMIVILGASMTSRFHFPINDYFDGFIGGGGSYFWFSTRMEDPYWGELQKPRNRSGFGGIIETGINTNLFSNKFLVILNVKTAFLRTSGKTLSIKNENDIKFNEDRIDKYVTITLGLRYMFDR